MAASSAPGPTSRTRSRGSSWPPSRPCERRQTEEYLNNCGQREEESVDSDDLLRMLDLAGKDAAREETAEPAITTPSEAPLNADASPTALELDEWGLRRGRQALAESDRLRQTGLDDNAVADFHGAAFEPEPRLNDSCADPLRREFLVQLLQAADYRALHASTMLEPAASAIAAAAFAEQFASLQQQDGEGGEGAEMDREM